MKASSESGLWAMEISRMAAEVAGSDWVLTECTDPFDEDYAEGREPAWRWRKRSQTAANDAAATTLSASPGRNGMTDSSSTARAEACVSIASQRAPVHRMTRLPSAALIKAETNPRRRRR